MSNAAPTLYIITATLDHAVVTLALDEDGPSVVNLATVNELAAKSDDPAATLKAWGVWTTTDLAKARRALSRAKKSAPGRWAPPLRDPLGIYTIN